MRTRTFSVVWASLAPVLVILAAAQSTFGGYIPFDIGTLGGNQSEAYAINSAGQIVGDAITGDSLYHAAFWNSGSAATDLGTLGGWHSEAHAINSAGQIVGGSSTTSDSLYHAVFWNSSSSAAIDLGTLGGDDSGAFGVNRAGQVVGWSNPNGSTVQHATFWNSSSSAAMDLNSLIPPGSGWILAKAYGINDSGQIVGYGTFDGHTRAFLLTPSGVPEPATITLLALGAMILFRRRSRAGP